MNTFRKIRFRTEVSRGSNDKLRIPFAGQRIFLRNKINRLNGCLHSKSDIEF